ncbi:MAG: hypothetical protein D6721_05910 [Gammaproteobacteria bacterium]|nr:MAG: hypothetical protein D6721_05910 [Gammaproteobacteria bacterium]
MNETQEKKEYGIRGRLPEGDPMRAPHLLGEDWQWERWFSSREERDRMFEAMQAGLVYYRPGDRASVCLEKIERTR